MGEPSWGVFLKMAGIGLGGILLLHSPIILTLIFGSKRAKEQMWKEIGNYHPPGHE